MLTTEIYGELYNELIDVMKGISFRANKAILYDEINLQMAVLNIERAIAHHGRETVISNLQEIVDKQETLWELAAKELFILELSKNIDWE